MRKYRELRENRRLVTERKFKEVKREFFAEPLTVITHTKETAIVKDRMNNLLTRRKSYVKNATAKEQGTN